MSECIEINLIVSIFAFNVTSSIEELKELVKVLRILYLDIWVWKVLLVVERVIEDFTHLLAKVLIVLGVLALEAQFNLLLHQQSALIDILRMVHCVKHEENKIVQRFRVIYGSFLIVFARLDAMLEERVNLAQERRRVIYKRIVLLIFDLWD